MELIPITISVVALAISVATYAQSRYKFAQSNLTRQRKCVYAVYYHVTQMELFLKSLAADSFRKKIETNELYAPYAVQSSDTDLTYDQIIEIMEWLDGRKEEEVMLEYFYSQSEFHAHIRSFELGFVRNWPVDRKLALWDGTEKRRQRTLIYAKQMKEILGRKKFSPNRE